MILVICHTPKKTSQASIISLAATYPQVLIDETVIDLQETARSLFLSEMYLSLTGGMRQFSRKRNCRGLQEGIMRNPIVQNLPPCPVHTPIKTAERLSPRIIQ
jgi:hypothetical protein